MKSKMVIGKDSLHFGNLQHYCCAFLHACEACDLSADLSADSASSMSTTAGGTSNWGQLLQKNRLSEVNEHRPFLTLHWL